MHQLAQPRRNPVAAHQISPDREDDFDCVAVRDAVEMAGALSAASRSQAKPFAIAMHERACFEDSDEKRDFWSLVVQHLDTPVL